MAKDSNYWYSSSKRINVKICGGVPIKWNPSIVATIGEQPFGHYRGVATSQGFLFLYSNKLLIALIDN